MTDSDEELEPTTPLLRPPGRKRNVADAENDDNGIAGSIYDDDGIHRDDDAAPTSVPSNINDDNDSHRSDGDGDGEEQQLSRSPLRDLVEESSHQHRLGQAPPPTEPLPAPTVLVPRQPQAQPTENHQHHHHDYHNLQAANDDRPHSADRRNTRRIPWVSFFLIGILGGLALFLQVTVWSLQVKLHELKQRQSSSLKNNINSNNNKHPRNNQIPDQKQHQQRMMDSTTATTTTTSSSISSSSKRTATTTFTTTNAAGKIPRTTVLHSKPTSRRSLYQHAKRVRVLTYTSGQDWSTCAQAFWNAARRAVAMAWHDPIYDLPLDPSAPVAVTMKDSHQDLASVVGTQYDNDNDDDDDDTVDRILNRNKNHDRSSHPGGNSESSWWKKLWIGTISSNNDSSEPVNDSNVLFFDRHNDSATTITDASTRTVMRLIQAAEAGHSTAQTILAGVLSTGFVWPVYGKPNMTALAIQEHGFVRSSALREILLHIQVHDSWSSLSSSTIGSSSSSNNHFRSNNDDRPGRGSGSGSSTALLDEHVDDTDNKNNHSNSARWMRQQQNMAWMWWHIAAMDGNVEAAVAVAARMDQVVASTTGSSGTNSNSNKDSGSSPAASSHHNNLSSKQALCQRRLPYLAAAAHGIMDILESDLHSRAKVSPAKDKHILYQVHLHGSTASQLHVDNRPDETATALQFYWVRATDAAAASKHPGQTASAAYTLAKYYHYGLRGVVQNLTTALHFYERAAMLEHWEAAGQAGTMYLWGMGTEQDVVKAHKYFRIGAPFAFDTCRRKWQQKIKQVMDKKHGKKNDDDDGGDKAMIYTCDAASLNGLGVLHLMGAPMLIGIDPEAARDYFSLSKDQGYADASYHLAMMKLGYKTYWKDAAESAQSHEDLMVDDQGQAITARFLNKDELFPLTGVGVGSVLAPGDVGRTAATLHRQEGRRSTPSAADYQAILTDLTTAAGKGHLQARHRLAMIYERGVVIHGSSSSTAATTGGSVSNSRAASSALLSDSKNKPIIWNADCEKAVKNYKFIVDHASPHQNRRLRRAYKLYMAGDTAGSLRHYIAAAELGSEVAQVNAAFLLERGECLGGMLNPVECARAAGRYWKAAAEKDCDEANLRVGDFYYYGRFRSEEFDSGLHPHGRRVVGPYGWLQYVLYPEEFLPHFAVWLRRRIMNRMRQWLGTLDDDTVEQKDAVERATAIQETEVRKRVDEDLTMSARYYKKASELSSSARANYNLGFMYEWGLGLKQDFPLAKRHYDLALSQSQSEGDYSIVLALTAMHLHERVVKLWIAWTGQRHDGDRGSDVGVHANVGPTPTRTTAESESRDMSSSSRAIAGGSSGSGDRHIPAISTEAHHGSSSSRSAFGRPVPPSPPPTPPPPPSSPKRKVTNRDKLNVIVGHVFSWESFLILILTIALSALLRRRRT